MYACIPSALTNTHDMHVEVAQHAEAVAGAGAAACPLHTGPIQASLCTDEFYGYGLVVAERQVACPGARAVHVVDGGSTFLLQKAADKGAVYLFGAISGSGSGGSGGMPDVAPLLSAMREQFIVQPKDAGGGVGEEAVRQLMTPLQMEQRQWAAEARGAAVWYSLKDGVTCTRPESCGSAAALERVKGRVRDDRIVQRVLEGPHPARAAAAADAGRLVLGAFALTHIDAGFIVGDYTAGAVLLQGDSDCDPLTDTQFSVDDRRKRTVAVVDVHPLSNTLAALSDPRGMPGNPGANCVFEQFVRIACAPEAPSVHVCVRALRDIAVGEELLVDYGKEFWKTPSTKRDTTMTTLWRDATSARDVELARLRHKRRRGVASGSCML
jgi:hypothetical protein